MSDIKGQLFDKDIVREIVAAAIILFLIEDHKEEIDEDKVADFVIKNNYSREEFHDKLELTYRTIYFS